jgi:hypothetical protein
VIRARASAKVSDERQSLRGVDGRLRGAGGVVRVEGGAMSHEDALREVAKVLLQAFEDDHPLTVREARDYEALLSNALTQAYNLGKRAMLEAIR